jgi:hypothetical protein
MATKVKFISTDKLREYSIIEKDVQDESLKVAIYKAQTVHVQKILGSSLYQDLYNKISGGTLTSSVDLTLMNDHVVPLTVEYASYEWHKHSAYKSANEGIMKPRNEHYDSADLDEVKWVMEGIKETAEILRAKTIDFLCDNANDYPAYKDSTDDFLDPSEGGGFYMGIT